jgi:Carboxypeptidase regulatory-like domain/TonB-dependent Receptor Plug Domain
MIRRLLPRIPRAATLLAALALVWDAPAEAQRGRATLRVTVSVQATGEPVMGARVAVEGTRDFAVTDQAGAAQLGGLPAGERMVEVRMLGLETRRVPVTLAEGAEAALPVRMELQPVELEAVRAEARMRTRGTRMLTSNGFFDRKTLGSGTFLTRAEIERLRPRFLSDVLRRTTSMKMQQGMFGRSRSSSRRQQNPGGFGMTQCQTLFFVNALPVQNFEPDEMRPEDIEGIEIYDGAADVPSAFARNSAACGAVVIWMRIN